MSSRTERQSFETDHGVATPIPKPVISRDNGPGFVAGGLRQRLLLRARSRLHDELVGGQLELPPELVLPKGGRERHQFFQAALLGPQDVLTGEVEHVPRLDARHQRDALSSGEPNRKVPGTEEILNVFRAAVTIDPIRDAFTDDFVRDEDAVVGTETQLEARSTIRHSNLIPSAVDRDRKRPGVPLSKPGIMH